MTIFIIDFSRRQKGRYSVRYFNFDVHFLVCMKQPLGSFSSFQKHLENVPTKLLATCKRACKEIIVLFPTSHSFALPPPSLPRMVSSHAHVTEKSSKQLGLCSNLAATWTLQHRSTVKIAIKIFTNKGKNYHRMQFVEICVKDY